MCRGWVPGNDVIEMKTSSSKNRIKTLGWVVRGIDSYKEDTHFSRVIS